MEKLNSENFKTAIKSEKLSLVDFSASWCMPCKMFKPIVEELATKMTDINVYNVDIDECEEISKEYRIFSVPTLLLFKNGEIVDSSVGLLTYDDLEEFVNKNK
ncbi:MAG: thioredoxin [Clostridia bacterium]|nr:thioredoxin [Clostridia bacterium]